MDTYYTYKYKIANHVLVLRQFFTMGLTSTFSLTEHYTDKLDQIFMRNVIRWQRSWRHHVLGRSHREAQLLHMLPLKIALKCNVGYLFIFWWSGHYHLMVNVAGCNPWCRNQADQGKYPGWTWNCCQVEADGMCFFYRQPIKKHWHRHPPPPSSHVAHVALSCKNDSWHNAKNKAHPLLFVKYVLVIGGLNMQEYIYVCNCAHWGERKYQMLSICEQKWFMLDSACVCGWGRGSFSYQLILHLLPTFCHPSRSFSWFG